MMSTLKTHIGRSFRIGLYLYAVCFPVILAAQSPRSCANDFSRPLNEMLDEVAHRFDIRIGCKRFAADTVLCPYADFRVRPYSLAETLDNLLRPLDLKWSAQGEKITVQPYEYYRRTPADGEKLLTWLSSRYTDRAAWERRRDEVLAVSDGGDWTVSYPESEYPYLRRIWALYGAEDAVENAHFPDERHDYGYNKRRAVYDFFARRLKLDASQADESKVELLPASALSSFADGLPTGAIASRGELERLLETTDIK